MQSMFQVPSLAKHVRLYVVNATRVLPTVVVVKMARICLMEVVSIKLGVQRADMLIPRPIHVRPALVPVLLVSIPHSANLALPIISLLRRGSVLTHLHVRTIL